MVFSQLPAPIVAAMHKAKAMLDALMGPSRDTGGRADDWKDKTVCKKFLVGFCPYDKAVLGGRRGNEACPKIHNENLREAFSKHEDGKPDSKFRRDCEDISIRDLMDCIAEKELYAKKQLENKRAEQKIRRLPDEVNTKISQMKREAMGLKEKAAALEDSDARLKEQLEKEAATAIADYEAFVKEEERKAALAAPRAQSCEVCGTAYTGDEEYKMHLEYRVHHSYTQIQEKLEELRTKKAEWEKTKKEADAAERKKRMEADIEKAERRAAKKDKEKVSDGEQAKRSRSKDKDKDRDKDEHKDKDRDKKKKDGSKSRSRSRREKGREREKEKQKEKDRRDKKRSRSRSMSRSKKNGRRSRSKSRSRSRKNSKRERGRSRGRKSRSRGKRCSRSRSRRGGRRSRSRR